MEVNVKELEFLFKKLVTGQNFKKILETVIVDISTIQKKNKKTKTKRINESIEPSSLELEIKQINENLEKIISLLEAKNKIE